MSEEIKKPVVLRVYKAGELQTIKQFMLQQIVIGQSPEVQLPLNNKSVSVIHAAIEQRETGYFICDLGSENGTLLNGRNILDSKLEDADEITIGDFKIEFYVGVPKPKSPPGGDAKAPSAPAPVATPTQSAPSSPAPNLASKATTPPPTTFDSNLTPPPIAQSSVNEPMKADIEFPTVITAVKTLEPELTKVESKPEAKREIKSEAKPEIKSEAKSETKAEDSKIPEKAPEIIAPPVEAKSEIKPEPKAEIKPEPKAEIKPEPKAEIKPEPKANKIPEPKPIRPPASTIVPTIGAISPKPVIITQAAQSPANLDITRTGGGAGTLSGVDTFTQRPFKKAHKRKSFAPDSKFKKIEDFVKPSRGTVIEVLVAWRERVLHTYHFSKYGTVTLGSHPDADIQVPLIFSRQRKTPLIKIDSRLVVMLTPEMTGEMTRQGQVVSFNELIKQNRIVRNGNISHLGLEQGEMLKIEMGELSIILRYVSESPKPLIAPLLDLTASESVGVIFAVVIIAILAIYNYLYTPPRPLDADLPTDDPPRQALVVINKPPPKQVVEATPAPSPSATPPPVKSTPTPKKVENVANNQPKKQSISDESKKKDAGKAAEVAPNNVKTPAKVVGVKRGGSIKTTDSAASQMQSKPKKDLTKAGVFSVFGGGGKNNELSKETAGTDALAGLSNSATGKSGLNENHSGDNLGTIYDTGRGGNGTAAVGRPDVKGGNGRGTGNTGYGSGGIGGGRQGVKIQPGGSEESFSGTIDREAIRRVIQANLKAIRACYERQLNRRPDLFGKLVIEWDIGDGGRVIRGHVKSSELSDPEVGNCVVNHLKTWTFPTPPTNNEVTVSYPFFFSN